MRCVYLQGHYDRVVRRMHLSQQQVQLVAAVTTPTTELAICSLCAALRVLHGHYDRVVRHMRLTQQQVQLVAAITSIHQPLSLSRAF
jgi:hypothetical protein